MERIVKGAGKRAGTRAGSKHGLFAKAQDRKAGQKNTAGYGRGSGAPAPQSSGLESFEMEAEHALQGLLNEESRDERTQFWRGAVAMGKLDKRSVAGGLLGGLLFLALAMVSLSLSSLDSMLAPIWLPSAGSVAFLLRARLTNEYPFFLTAFLASLIANLSAGSPIDLSAVFSIANMANVALVTWMTRMSSGESPDMTDPATLARFVWAGGIAGPAVSLSIATPALATGSDSLWDAATSWFLTDSMGMILIVPAILLLCNASNRHQIRAAAGVPELAALLTLSIVSCLLVFGQKTYPLLFLIPPITLLHAFRLGSLGTALHVTIIAIASTAMTWAGYGPIHQLNLPTDVQIQLIQAFIAANFLTGLPVAAILAGRDRLTLAAKESQRELALLTENITDAVLKLDVDGVCTYASPSVRDVLGRGPEDFLGKPIMRRTHEEASDRIEATLSRLLSGQSDKERLTYRRLLDDEDALPVFIEADCAIASDPVSGKREGVVVCARDVTDRVELELLLTRARRRAENAARAKSDFLANMSHEIRTPMNGVLGFAELMLQGKLDKDQRRYTEMIVDSGRSMMLLLNDILDLSKIEAGQIVIDMRPIDLHATLEECIALHRPAAAKKGLALSLINAAEKAGANDGQRLGLLTDGLRLRQIILNLLSNAVKFTETGEVEVSYSANAGDLVIKVRDTGIGISDCRAETVFSPFTQGDSETARRYGGTGLGLSISRQLAELLGGTLNVESVPGEGSTFTLSLPLKTVEREKPAPAPPPANAIMPKGIPQDARVLLVEDHDVNRVLATEMLERCGQDVEIAADGNEAISMVIDSVLRGAPFDLVLMDIQMPGCDGYTATRAIREEGIAPHALPIIALTANAFPEDIRAAREAGMQGHLAKPLKFTDLANTLARWLPTRIVETPMDRDIAEEGASEGKEPGRKMPVDGKRAPRERSTEKKKTQSPTLFDRWLTRRGEAVELVRELLDDGSLGAGTNAAVGQDEERRDLLIQHLHKLAGTAATFGETELGDQAARLERALRLEGKPGSEEDCEALAFKLLALADEPAQLADRGGSPQG